MRLLPVALIAALAASGASGSGMEGYFVPGIETGEVLMNVHVWGQVSSPGTHQVPAGCDLVAAISAAGGPGPHADLSRVRMVFDDSEYEYDLDDFLSGDGEPVPMLTPGMTVYVPVARSEWWKEALDIGYKIIIAVNLVWIMLER